MAAVEQIPQREALRLQLVAFAGNEPSTSFLEIRAKLTARAGMSQEFVSLWDLDRAARIIQNRGQVSDTYVGAAPRTQRKGTADAVERVHVLWADVDGPEALAALRDFRPLPGLVVRTGSDFSVHAYWPLRRPVSPAWAQRANRRLALALGADPAATDPARILRPAGTFNFKHGERRPVVCTRLELDVFTIEQVVGGLADDPRYLPAPARELHKVDCDGAVLDGLARSVREAQEGNRNNVLYWAACRVRDHEADGKLDGGDARELLRDAALSAGLPEHEADRTIASALDTRAAA